MSQNDTNPCFIAMGDIHLDELIWRKHRGITGDAFCGFMQVVDKAVAMGVPLVLLGDIFDCADPDPSLIQGFRSVVELAAKHIPIYAIQGNHDRRRTPWFSAVTDVVLWVGNGEARTINGVEVVGFDYTTIDEIQSHMGALTAALVDWNRSPRPQVMLVHQAAKQFLNIDGKWNFDLEWVPKGINLTLMGDIHMPLEFSYHDGAGRAYYTGSAHMRSISEIGDRSCIVLNKDLTVGRLPIYQRPARRIAITTESNPEEVIQGVQQWLSTANKDCPVLKPLAPLLWLRFMPEASELLTRVRLLAEASGTGVIVVEEELIGSVTADEKPVIDTSDMPSLLDILGTLIDREKEPKEFDLAAELLGVRSTKDVMPTIRSAYERFSAGAGA